MKSGPGSHRCGICCRGRMGSPWDVTWPKQEPNKKVGTLGPQGMAVFPNWPWMLEAGLALQTALGAKSNPE